MATYLFGQLSDPNVKVLHPLFDKFIDQNANIEWNITEDILYIEGKPVTDLTAIYMRNNVFEESTFKKYTNFHIRLCILYYFSLKNLNYIFQNFFQ